MITYDPLWETMKRKGVTKYKLIHKHGMAQKTMSRMTKNMPTETTTLDKLCNILECDISDIIKHIHEKDTVN